MIKHTQISKLLTLDSVAFPTASQKHKLPAPEVLSLVLPRPSAAPGLFLCQHFAVTGAILLSSFSYLVLVPS